ncbi:UDP-glucose lipid carrier transferase [Photobacterium iliopiscarium]|uniref:Undecaprenyl-phosphate glucose phosphotransferase n=1 Tax=Photobacterium iliopiscarium TaxID=56192 RepID=A0ABX5GPI2_9GAMM|nr:undecaprenyl-phosphate glucose phosphotransferase [Photobacterium iliopiscarium]KJG24379.1 UDP-glucose lipid carrier transferase [Photobacterium iliopiscarium]PST95798.1 undecaprenyl-phosphate glucose phosphotransferase [Photobacterium iliopiscarium]PSW93088.1 undecaprenyl-phosphate glucose phosphotransferase [Photobacterium iliopiscarium]
MRREAIKIADDGYTVLIKVSDFLLINLVLTFIISLRGDAETAIGLAASVLFSVIFLLVGEYSHLYKKYVREDYYRTTLKTFIVLLLSSFIWLILCEQLDALKGMDNSHLNSNLIVFWLVLSFVVLIAFKVGVIYTIRTVLRNTKQIRRIAIIGMTPGGLAIENALRNNIRYQKFEISYYDDRNEERFGYLSKTPLCGNIKQLIKLTKQGDIDEVYIALPMVAKDRIQQCLRLLSDTMAETYIVPDLYTYDLSISQITTVGNVQTFSVFGSPFEGMGAILKRIEDIFISSLIILLISPVLIAVAIGVKRSSPGPVLFKQDRYGLGGKKIKVWKFRSMGVMENDSVVTQATKNDPRVTKFGAFIRRTSLDELPQFFNVVQGSMSIVGPRPHAVAHNEEYRVLVDKYMLRHKVKPGITGLAQIKGFRGETDTLDKMEMRVKYDLKYIQNWTLSMDLKIIFLTIFKGFVSETAY